MQIYLVAKFINLQSSIQQINYFNLKSALLKYGIRTTTEF